MPTTTASTDLVHFGDGFTVALSALRLLWDLEERGFVLRVAADGALVVSPRSKLTAADDGGIRRHRDELVALVCYCEDVQ